MENNSAPHNILSKTNTVVINQFMHACADEICGYPGPTYELFASETHWTKEEYDSAYKLISALFENPALLRLDEEKMPCYYHDLPEEIKRGISNCIKVRQEQLARALLTKYSRKETKSLIDFDWRLKLIMGSSKLAALREPLLQLDLITKDSQNENTLSLELDRDELETLTNALESVAR